MIGALVGGLLGYRLGVKYLGPQGEKPLWNGHINNDPSQPAVSIGQVFRRGKTWYRLYIAAEGDCAMVGERLVYAEILALIQSWEGFFANGGTLNAWRLQNETRQQETAWMEDAMQDEPHDFTPPWFVGHSDGTVDDKCR